MNSLFHWLTLSLTLTATLAAHSAQLVVVNESNRPIAGAEIFIGDSLESPLLTDVNGTVGIPSKWAQEAPVTVVADGYLTATFLDLLPTETTLHLRKADSKNIVEAKGVTTHYADLKRDGKVNFSLVYPGFTRAQLSQLDIQSVISSDIDILNVATESVAVPSNISIPTQKESYIIPITIDKPLYRMTFKNTGDFVLMATHGQFPIKQVVGDFRNGKSFFEVLNHFRFLSGGQRDVTVNGSIDNQDIQVNKFNYDAKITSVAPQFPDSLAMFSFSVIQQGDLYFPADVKRVYSGQSMDLAIPSTSQNNTLVNILMPLTEAKKIGGDLPPTPPVDDEDQTEPAPDDIIGGMKMLFSQFAQLAEDFNLLEEDQAISVGGLSMAMTSAQEGAPLFLDLIPRPTLNGNIISSTAPKELEQIIPLGTKVILSEVVTTQKNNYELESTFKVWEALKPNWPTQIELPASQFKVTPGLKYRVEVIYLGKKVGQEQEDGENILNAVTHVTRNSFDF